MKKRIPNFQPNQPDRLPLIEIGKGSVSRKDVQTFTN